MGCASSTPVEPLGGPAAPVPRPVVQPQPAPAALGGAAAQAAAAPPAAQEEAQRSEPSLRMEVITKVHELQQQLALLSGHPLLALPDAAEVICAHMGVDLAVIYTFTDDTPPCAALMAAQGVGAALLERRVIARGADTSPMMLYAQAQGEGSRNTRLVVADAAVAKGGLPADFAVLCREAGLRSLAAIPVGPPGAAPLGVLLLGKKAPGCFADKSASVWLSAASTGLLQHMRPAQVAQASRILRTIEQAADPVAAISVLLQSGARFMWRATNIAMGVRLAVVGAGGRAALVFESARANKGRADIHLSAGKSGALALEDPAADVTVRELPLSNTLLASAVSMKQARFIKDCAAYMQNCPSPARDVFTHATEPVSSVVVVPLMVNDVALGALYFTQDTPCSDFSNIQDALLGFVHCCTLVLHNKLSGQIDVLQGMVNKAATSTDASFAGASDAHLSGGTSGGPQVIRQLDTDESEGDTEDGSDESVVPPMQSLSMSSASGRLSKVSSKRLCTEAMLKVLQQEIRKGKRRSVELSFVADHLVIGEPIGHGGFGRVFRGTWHKRPAAVKVMNARGSDREAVSDAMEMAVLSSLQHPNIVQVFSCLTDMVEAGAGEGSMSSLTGSSANSAGMQPVRYRRMLPGENGDATTYNVVVMEYCDRGTLADAVRKASVFHQQLDNGAIGVDLASVVDILIELAGSLQYMHRVSLLHGDVKLDNILLKSDPLRPLGFVPKLADFGLTKIIRESDVVVNHSGAGTVTHLAPECFQAGTQITTSVDVYAFGILMWEFYTGKRPYSGLTREAIMERVLRRGARPLFPAGAPAPYVELASACWSSSPNDRPKFAEVVSRLQAMADEMAAQAAAVEAGLPPPPATPPVSAPSSLLPPGKGGVPTAAPAALAAAASAAPGQPRQGGGGAPRPAGGCMSPTGSSVAGSSGCGLSAAAQQRSYPEPALPQVGGRGAF